MNNNKNLDLEDQLELKHLAELATSEIDRDIIRLNFNSIGQEEAFSFLVRNPKRRNDGRLTEGYYRTFRRLEDGGWKCSGVDPLTMDLSDWGCLKPNDPRLDRTKRKAIKYEHPHGVSTELFCLRVTYRIGLKIAKRNGLEAEAAYLERMAYANLSDEDRGFWQWVLDTPSLKILITEGAKKAASLLSAGYLAIGLPGIFAGYRSKINGEPCVPFLIPQLKLFATKGREIVFCFDQDTKPKTIANVNIATCNTGKLLTRKDCIVSVMGWDYPHKGIDDLISKMGAEILTKIFDDRQGLEQWRLDANFSLSSLPQTKVNVRYLDPLLKPDDLAGSLIAIKSPKGTGKTEYLAEVIAPYLNKGRSVLVITHRIQLAKALAKRFGINHLSEVRLSAMGALFGYSLCVDSLHPKSQAKFNPENWEESIVIIDECEQVIWHLLNSNTCQLNRVSILQTFEKLLRTVAESNGTIVLSDADLSKVSIDYIQKLTENRLKLWVMTNSYNPNKGRRRLYSYATPANLLSAAKKAIEVGERVIIHCTAQKAKSTWSAQNIETLLEKAFPSKTILRIDSETVADPSHPAYGCVENINEVVQDYDIVLATQTIETGISIDVARFDSVWALANGTQTVDAVCQAIERVRSDVARHICITTGSITPIGNGSAFAWSLSKSQVKVAETNIAALALAGFTEDSTPNSFHLDAWAEYAARTNQGYHGYKQNILNKLQREGYDIYHMMPEIDAPAVAELKVEIKEVKKVNYKTERECKIAEPNPTDFELKSLQKKVAKTKGERYQEAKGVLCRRYLTEDLTDELLLKDDAGWYPQIQLYYYLTIGREYLADRDRAKLKSLSPEGHKPFTPDLTKTLLSKKVEALEAVNIRQFFGDDLVFTKDKLEEWHERLKGCAANLKEYLGVSIGAKATPIVTAQKLLHLLGYRLEALDRIRIDGVLVRRYQGVDCNADDRNAVFDRWLEYQAKLDAVEQAA